MSLSDLIDFGKYAGKTYSEILACDVSYARWLTNQPSVEQQLKSALLAQLPVDEGYILSFGKYKNKPLTWVQKNDEKYYQYLQKAEYIKQNMPKLSKLLSEAK